MNKELRCFDYGYSKGDYFLVMAIEDNGMGIMVASLVWDDMTAYPNFKVQCVNQTYKKYTDGLLYISLRRVIKIEINDRQGLDFYCMLYPQATEVLTEWFNTRRFHELQRC